MLLSLLVAAGVLVGIVVLVMVAWYVVTRPIAHITTGEQRRMLYPPDDPTGTGGAAVSQCKDLRVHRYLRKLNSGAQAFCQIITPQGSPPTHVLVFLHGYGSQSDMYAEALSYFVRRGAVVVLPDLPCHGRSDGTLVYMPDWWAWVDQVWETLDIFVPLARDEGTGRPMKVFVSGMSLGGGLSACLSVLRPTYFDGVVLVAPMLFVSDDLKPSKLVQQIFKRFLVPLLRKWPITPMKSIEGKDFRIYEQGVKCNNVNPLSFRGLKARLGSAKELAFTFPEWMEKHMKQVENPFLILHGTEDKITDPAISQKLYDEASAADKDIKLYDGAFHCELLGCVPGLGKLIDMAWLPEQVAITEKALGDMVNWMAARL